MSMNNQFQNSPSSSGGGASGGADLTLKDVVIMLGTAAVVVFIFGTLAMDGDDGSSSEVDGPDFSMDESTAPADQRLDMQTGEGYVAPEEAAGPRTGQLDREVDPNQLSERDVNVERLRQGDLSDFQIPDYDEAPRIDSSDIEAVEQFGGDFSRPDPGQRAPEADDIMDNMPSQIPRNRVDIEQFE